nr:hypothetical protein CFP56_27170 [Quercus suber]
MGPVDATNSVCLAFWEYKLRYGIGGKKIAFVYHECFEHETGLGIDAETGKLDASDEWWTQKIAACPKVGTFRKKGMPNLDSMDIMFGGTVAMGKNAFCMSGQMLKETTEGSEDSADGKEFLCVSSMAEEENASMAEEENTEAIQPELPIGRVKKIMKLDNDINKVNSEALFLVTCSAELFL